jgi:flagellar secretion chaperone FliS
MEQRLMSAATQSAARNHYATNAVRTASPARLLVMLYDRLVRDLVLAEQALRTADLSKASSELLHAQQIVMELKTSLDLTAWEGAAGLADLYTWLYGELVAANLGKDPARVAECRAIVEPLREAWSAAALQTAQAGSA